MAGARLVLHAVTLTAMLAVRGVALAQPTCPGDCDGDGVPRADEVEAALHALFDPTRCPAADADGSGAVTAADLLRVRAAVVEPPAGCGSSATAVATPTPTATVPATPGSTWIALAPLPGGARQEVGVAALDAVVFVIGGITASGHGSSRVDTYRTATADWAPVDDLPRPLHHVGAAAVNGSVYSVGGFISDSFQAAVDVTRYDSARGEWIGAAPLPAPRGALALAELDGLLYAVGGSGEAGSVATHTVYDPIAEQWSERAALPSPRNHLAAVGLDGFLYVVGGRRDGAGNVNTGELDRYDPAADRWDVLPPMPTARSGHAAAVLDGRIVVMGGEVAEDRPPNFVFPEVEIYDPAANAWTAIDAMPVPRHGIGAVTIGDLIYVPGGATRAGFAATDRVDVLRILPWPEASGSHDSTPGFNAAQHRAQ